MCTFQTEHKVVVCDLAIGQVRQALDPVFAERVRYEHLEGEGTLVEADPSVPSAQFADLAQSAIDAAQGAD